MKHKLSVIVIFLIFIFPLSAKIDALQFSIPSETKNLYYSQNRKSFYYSIDSSIMDKMGFYIIPMDSLEIKRLFCPLSITVHEKLEEYVLNAELPDYQAFFTWLYTFADSGTEPVFAVKDANGKWYFEEDAFTYLCEEYLKRDRFAPDPYQWFYLDYTSEFTMGQRRFLLEKCLFDKNKGFDEPVTAFTYNGYPTAFGNLRLSHINEGFFLENSQGIWYLEKLKDGNVSLCHLIDSDNNFLYKPVNELQGIIKYSPSCARVIDDIFVFDREDGGFICYDSVTAKLNEFTSEIDLNKYFKNRLYMQTPQFITKNAVIFLLLILAIILLLLLIIPKIIFAINQKNPLKRKYCFTQKELNKKIFGVQETERRKISRDIHDSVIQDIRVLGIESDLIKVSQTDKDNFEHKKKIQQISTDCIIKLRNICYNLAPAELSGHSEEDSSKVQLVSMLNTLSSQFTLRTHIPCSVKVKDDFNYPPFEHEVTENLFRIVQEALTNTEKHAYATEVSIFIKSRIIAQKEYMIIYISDDGVGCDIKELNLYNDAHRGLRNMKERMDLIGGKLDFFSKPNEGLQVILTIEVR